MVKWGIGIVVLVVLLVVGDVVGRKYAERQVAHDIITHEKGATAKVRISSFPFVGRLAVSRQVQKITADVRNVPVNTKIGNFTLDEVDLTLKGVKVDLGPLVAGSDGAVKSIKSGTVSAVLSQDTLAQLVKLPVTLGNGTASVTVAGVQVAGSVSMAKDNVLHLSGAGVAVDVPIGAIPVLPCIAAVAITPGRLVMSCSFNQVPAALLQAASGSG
jgi:hypothetical protein